MVMTLSLLPDSQSNCMQVGLSSPKNRMGNLIAGKIEEKFQLTFLSVLFFIDARNGIIYVL